MEYLVLGPGGMGVFTILGSLMKYEDELKHIKEISGSSAGAILAVALALQIPLREILDSMLNIDIANLTKFKIKNFVHTFGFVNMKPLREAMLGVCKCDPTFSELKTKVYISSYCVNRSRTEYFSVDTHPNMKVLDAVCMSITVPILFSAARYDGMLYIDGCTKECYPIQPFVNKKPEKIMCIRLTSCDTFLNDITNIKDYIKAIIAIATRVVDTNTIHMGKDIELYIENKDMFNFTMTHDDKLKMLLKGAIS